MQEKNREVSILKSRIIQFLDLKEETKSSFYKKTGISNGLLSQPGGISEDNLLKFLNTYHDVSIVWLLFGKGSPIKSNDNSECNTAPVNVDGENKSTSVIDTIQLQNEFLKTANKVIILLEENAQLKDRLRKYEGADQ